MFWKYLNNTVFKTVYPQYGDISFYYEKGFLQKKKSILDEKYIQSVKRLHIYT